MPSLIISALIILGLLIALFLIFRQIVLWYFRINQGIELLNSIDEKLEELLDDKPSNLNVASTIGEMRTD